MPVIELACSSSSDGDASDTSASQAKDNKTKVTDENTDPKGLMTGSEPSLKKFTCFDPSIGDDTLKKVLDEVKRKSKLSTGPSNLQTQTGAHAAIKPRSPDVPAVGMGTNGLLDGIEFIWVMVGLGMVAGGSSLGLAVKAFFDKKDKKDKKPKKK